MSAPALDTVNHGDQHARVAGRLSVRTAPRREPPFNDELTGRRLSVVGPMDEPLPFAADGADPGYSLSPTSFDRVVQHPSTDRPLPELAVFARRFVIAVVETATGRRAVGQLNRHTAPSVQAGLARDAGKINRLGTAQRPATLHSLHLTEPAAGVAEVAAVLRVEDRFRALAMRLEGLDGRWRCVRLQIG